MFFSAWREMIFLEELAFNMSLWNESDVNRTAPSPIPDEIWVTRVGVFAIGGTAIAILGLLCNTVSIVVLANFSHKSSAPFLLIFLEVMDSILLLSEMLLETLTTMSQAKLLTNSYRDFIRPIYVVMYPVPHIAQTATTTMTVVITVERYIAVAKPLLASTVCSKKWARRAVLVILLWALLFHLPLYMAYSYDYHHHPATNASRIIFHRTEFGESHFYNYWFVVWINLTFEFLIPFVFIVVFNVLMIRALHASNSLTSSSVTRAANKRFAREGRLTGMVIAVTVIFFICELFPAVALIMVRGKDAFTECSVACAHFVSVADTMVLLNSGVNFVAYCAIGKQFRDIFARIFLRRCPGGGRGEKLHPSLGDRESPILCIDAKERCGDVGGGGGGGGGIEDNGHHLLLLPHYHFHRESHLHEDRNRERRRSSHYSSRM